jgi:hypothetical protein
MKAKGLVTEEELLKLIPMTSRILRQLRYKRKIPFYAPSYRIRLYDVDEVKQALSGFIVHPKMQQPMEGAEAK